MRMRHIDAKVAGVLTSTQIALNAGSDQAVRLNDKVRLYRLVRVIDPESKEDLGGVQLTKLNLRVNSVQARLCTAVVVDTDSPPTTLSSLLDVTRVRRLKEITIKEGLHDANTVRLEIGESAIIEGPERVEEDELI